MSNEQKDWDRDFNEYKEQLFQEYKKYAGKPISPLTPPVLLGDFDDQLVHYLVIRMYYANVPAKEEVT